MSELSEFLDSFDGGTRKVYSAGLSLFQQYYGKPLSAFLDEVEADLKLPRRERRRVARNALKGFVDYLAKLGKSPKTIRAYVGAVQSFARYYDVNISTRYVGLPSSQPKSKKFPWTTQKVYEFVQLIRNPMVKTIAVCLFQSGISISDLLALTYGDIKYEFERGIVPLCFDLVRIKTDVPYMTFIGKWGFKTLSEYLKDKRLTLNSPIFPGGESTKRLVEYHFKQAGEKFYGEYQGRNPCGPHTLRAAFRTILGDAGADRDVVEFWMGHKLPEQLRVYHSRTRDGWRALYSQYAQALEP